MEEGAKFINFLLPRLSANRVEETPPASPEESFGSAALFGGGEKARKEDARMIIFRSPLRSDPFPHKMTFAREISFPSERYCFDLPPCIFLVFSSSALSDLMSSLVRGILP